MTQRVCVGTEASSPMHQIYLKREQLLLKNMMGSVVIAQYCFHGLKIKYILNLPENSSESASRTQLFW